MLELFANITWVVLRDCLHHLILGAVTMKRDSNGRMSVQWLEGKRIHSVAFEPVGAQARLILVFRDRRGQVLFRSDNIGISDEHGNFFNSDEVPILPKAR